MITKVEILNAKLLIVDDQASNISLLEQLLSESGYLHVASTQNPLEVIALHEKNQYDLILLDLQMPYMDGFEVMEALKKNDNDAYLPVLVLTAQPSHKLRALKAGAKDFISKPFDLIEVKTRIQNMLEVRLLYKKLDHYNKVLEQKVEDRTAELRASEARYRSLTELASDWYWEQDAQMNFTKVSGPVLEILGTPLDGLLDLSKDENRSKMKARISAGWIKSELEHMETTIASRKPFLDYILHRQLADGSQRSFQVSGEPMFDLQCKFTGYRGIGVELINHENPQDTEDKS